MSDLQENPNGNWRKWTNHILFTIVMAFLIIFMRFISSNQALQTQIILDKIENVKETMTKNDVVQAQKLDKVAEKTDTICAKVAEHDTLLHIPWTQRQEYYKSFKIGGAIK